MNGSGDRRRYRFLPRVHRRPGGPARVLVMLAWCALASAFGPLVVAAEPPPSGEEIYQRQCARCHGAQGQGMADEGTGPFAGSHTLADLSRIIDETMPEDDPTACQGPAAQAVAHYIHETFLAADARAHAAQVRIKLSRLTVRQYDNAVADLMGTFLGQGKLGDERGLKARYFNSRNFGRDKQVTERTDPRVLFDFGEKSPEEGTIGDEEFAIRWQGGVLTDETGDYEFCVATENGVKLWVNDPKQPLIDAWVASGGLQEHRATIRLLGGRVYPIRLEFFKFKIKTASVKLSWVPPHRSEEVIPQRNLSPDWFPPGYVSTTVFPPDDSSEGYERGTSVSQAWKEAVATSAIEVAHAVVENLDALAKSEPDAADRRDRVKEFCYRFAERAFRRGLTAEQKQFFVDQFFENDASVETAAKISGLLVLQSPRFLYIGLGDQQLDDYDVASRLSFALWDSLPDQSLLEAARAGQLRTPDEVARQAQRMLGDFRTKAKLRVFLHRWLDIDHLEGISKDTERFPGFDDSLASDLRKSLDLFLDEVVWNGSSDFRELLLANYLFVNRPLADYYGIPAEAGEDFQKVSCDPARCAGILTHPYLMARFAYHKTSSPIHRGVFVVRSLLGRFLKPPPIAVAPLDESVDPGLTTRQRVLLQTREPTCQTCHGMINALGFGLEKYDAVGRFRQSENEQPVDASGSYQDQQGRVVEFTGARQLAEVLAASEETHRCFVKQLFHNVAKQPVVAYGPETMSSLEKSFAESGFNIQALLVEIASTSALGTNKE